MSLPVKTVSGIFGLGAISVTSLAFPRHAEPKIVLPPPIKSVVITVNESVQKLIQEGYKGCVNLKNGASASLFYVCVKTEKSGSNLPFFFYYDKQDKSGNYTDKFPQISQINQSSQASSSSSLEVQLTKGGSKTVSSYSLPAWLRSSQNYGKSLKEMCKVDEKSSSSFTLKCNDREVQKNIQI